MVKIKDTETKIEDDVIRENVVDYIKTRVKNVGSSPA